MLTKDYLIRDGIMLNVHESSGAIFEQYVFTKAKGWTIVE